MIGVSPFTEGRVGSVPFLAVLDVDVRDALVILGNELHRGAVVTRNKVADIDIGTIELRQAKCLLPLRGGRWRRGRDNRRETGVLSELFQPA